MASEPGRPGKRPRLTPNPAIAVFDGGMVMPFGSPGGDVQTQSMLPVLLNLAVFDVDLVSAIKTPRFATYSSPSSFEPHEMLLDCVMLEARFPAATHSVTSAMTRKHGQTSLSNVVRSVLCCIMERVARRSPPPIGAASPASPDGSRPLSTLLARTCHG